MELSPHSYTPHVFSCLQVFVPAGTNCKHTYGLVLVLPGRFACACVRVRLLHASPPRALACGRKPFGVLFAAPFGVATAHTLAAPAVSALTAIIGASTSVAPKRRRFALGEGSLGVSSVFMEFWGRSVGPDPGCGQRARRRRAAAAVKPRLKQKSDSLRSGIRACFPSTPVVDPAESTELGTLQDVLTVPRGAGVHDCLGGCDSVCSNVVFEVWRHCGLRWSSSALRSVPRRACRAGGIADGPRRLRGALVAAQCALMGGCGRLGYGVTALRCTRVMRCLLHHQSCGPLAIRCSGIARCTLITRRYGALSGHKFEVTTRSSMVFDANYLSSARNKVSLTIYFDNLSMSSTCSALAQLY